MKKKIIIISIILAILLLIPIPMRLKDGGTIEYKAILYKVSKVHKINTESKTGYEEGIIIEVLGIQVFNNVKYEVNIETLNIENIKMEIKEGTLTNKGATIIITDTSGKENVYGEEYKLEKKENEIWKELEVIVEGNYAWNLIGYSVGEDNKLELEINWEWLYGSLPKGEYRIVKYIQEKNQKYYFTVEFKIEDKQIEKPSEEITQEKNEQTTVLELKTEVETINPGTTEQEFTRYKTYIKDKKLYAKNLNTNEEQIIFENEEVENITIMPICCAGNGNLLILTTNGNVYISKKDCNYQFNFDFPFEKLESKDIISLEIVENYDDFSITLYGKNTKGEQIKLYEVK